MGLDQYQQAVVDEVRKGKGSLVVNARAGSGKTTTIIAALSEVQPGYRTLLCAFSKDIETELRARAPTYVDVRTLHSLGFECIRGYRRVQINKSKLSKIVYPLVYAHLKKRNRRQGFADSPQELASRVMKLVGLAKNYLAGSEVEVAQIAVAHNLVTTFFTAGELALLATAAIRRGNENQSEIDFDDMMYWPAKYNMMPSQYDVVFVDEAQDLSPSQVDFVLKLVAAQGRLIAVGDRRQAIYQFRGGDSQSMDLISSKFQAKQLPLSVTYRCPTSVVDHVREIVPDLQARPNAPVGKVQVVPYTRLWEPFGPQPGDFVLSRTNAPLVGLATNLWKRRVPAIVLGKQFGDTLMSMLDESDASDLEDLKDFLRIEYAKLTMLTSPDEQENVAIMRDRLDALKAMAEACDNLAELRFELKRMFSDTTPTNAVVCSTVHKVKGQERDRVWLLVDTFSREDPRGGDTETQNLYYVAATRAKASLFLCCANVSKTA